VTAPAIPVTVAQAVSEDMPLTVDAIGNAQAWTSDAIFAQVSGKLTRVDFVEGADVRAGQLLAQVDPRPYQAALLQAEGNLAKDRAMLAGAERDLQRYQRLLAENAIAAQMVDDEAATVAQDKGAVLLDEGQLAAARINLAYCNITSPISGRAGVRLVDPGNLVTAGGSMASAPSTAAATNNAASAGSSSGGAGGSSIVVINQIQPIAVTFTVPEGQFQRLLAASSGFRQPLAVQAYSQETGALLDAGQLAIADNRVDAATGTVQLKARFPNAARQLWPGQFVNVKLVLQTLRNATVVPVAAVNRGPQGQFAFVVGPNHTALARPIAIEGTEGASAIVTSGLAPGDLVVTDGQMILKNGSLVRVAQAGPSPRPAP
jgi:multidrug efflux system membrane fusion protein